MQSKITNILAILLGLAMIFFGATKFMQMDMSKLTAEQIETFSHFGAIKWLMPLIGIGEIIGGILLAWPKTRALGAVALFPITLGILAHGLSMDASNLPMAIPIFILNIWFLFTNKDRLLGLISSSTTQD